MKKSILCLLAVFALQTAYAAEEKNFDFDTEEILSTEYERSSNNCCHNCRLSKSRKAVKQVKYVDCSKCKKTFCERCYEDDRELKPDGSGCVVCREECCCTYKNQECDLEHKHCYTYTRTKSRQNKRKASDEKNEKSEAEPEKKKIHFSVKILESPKPHGLGILVFTPLNPQLGSFL